ncbi:hypothetical protein [Chloroflexus sp.]|uniref:hypothetical protein n=1 Tax=Chloroflexus sp. TaxID=1904827 RepID=UPI002ADDB2AB|nr:hypothetical protein [Chloroflexus sp.]
MHYPHVTLRQAGCKHSPWREWRGAGFQPAWMHPLDRRQVLAVAAGAQARIACNITVYAQGSHSCLTDSLIGTSTFSNLVTRMGSGMPRAELRARLARQHGCRTPNPAPRVTSPENRIHAGVCSGNAVRRGCDHSWLDQVMSLIHRLPWMVR